MSVREPGAQVPVVVLGGESIAVSVARSLGPAGVPVHALGVPSDPVRRSRWCHSFTDLGAYVGVQERWLRWLEADGPRGAVILPCNDDALELVARNRPRLVELGYRPIEADDDVVLAMLDKERTYELARAAGIETPRTATVRAEHDIHAALEDLLYPCALKPLQSHVFARHFGSRKVVLVGGRDEARRELVRLLELGLEMMVTEIVPGPDDSYCSYYSYIDQNGEPLFHFTKRKLRQWPNHFGLGTYHATSREEDTRLAGLRFFQGVGLRGLGNVEFKRDARDGRLKLIECNHRLTAANELVRAAGLDLALLAYNRTLGRPPPPLQSYRAGLHTWHPLEDLRALHSYRASGELTVGPWARSLLAPQRFSLLSASDPLPALASWSEKGRRGARMLWRASNRSTPGR